MRMRNTFVTVVVVACLGGLPAIAASPQQSLPPRQQPDEAAPASGSVQLSATDRMFLDEAIRGGIAEVNEMRLTQLRAGNPELRKGAEAMEREHVAANRELRRIAAVHGMEPPVEPPDARSQFYARLQDLEGASYDAAFVPAAREAHGKSIAAYEKASAQSSNADIQKFATETLPTLRAHFAMLNGMDVANRTSVSPRPAATPGE